MEAFKITCGDQSFEVFAYVHTDKGSSIYEVLIGDKEITISADDDGKLIANYPGDVDPELISIIIDKIESYYL